MQASCGFSCLTADERSAVNVEDGSSEDVQRKTPSAFNFIMYGLPNLVVIWTAGEIQRAVSLK